MYRAAINGGRLLSSSSWIINPKELLVGEGTQFRFIRRSWNSMLTVRIIFSEDVYCENVNNNGIAYLASRMLLEGSEKWNSQQLNIYMEKYAIEAVALPGGLQFTCLKDSWPKLQNVLEEVLKRPKLEKQRFLKVKCQIEQELKSSFDDSDQLAHLYLRQAIFDKSPANLLPTGLPDTIAKIEDFEIREYWTRNLQADGMQIYMVAPMDCTQIQKSLEGLLPKSAPGFNFRTDLPVAEARKQIQNKFVLKNRKKTSIAMGHVGIRRWSEDYTCLRLIDQVLGASSGFTSRLASKLREEMGLCYYIYGDVCSSAGRIPGIFQIMMGTSPENVEEAIGQIKLTVAELLHEGPELMELEDARSYLLGSMAFSFETHNSLVQLMTEKQNYNLDEDFLVRDRERLEQINSEDFHKVARKTFDLSKLHSVVVGAKRPAGWM